jgi:hypothetical protein
MSGILLTAPSAVLSALGVELGGIAQFWLGFAGICLGFLIIVAEIWMQQRNRDAVRRNHHEYRSSERQSNRPAPDGPAQKAPLGDR